MESTLTLKIVEVESKVGLFLGWGAGIAYGDRAWTARQSREIRDCIESGLRRFYFPSPALTKGMTINWSFLHPAADLEITVGQRAIPLPGNFGGVDDECITVTDSSSQMFHPIRIQGPLDSLYAMNPAQTGRPQVASIVPMKGITHSRGQQFQLEVYPLADATYTLRLHYFFLPNYPDGTEAYCYGGVVHAETILESCLAVAEERRDNQPGVHLAAFQRQILASMQADRKMKPQAIGKNLDRSDDWHGINRRDYAAAVSYEGIVYD